MLSNAADFETREGFALATRVKAARPARDTPSILLAAHFPPRRRPSGFIRFGAAFRLNFSRDCNCHARSLIEISTTAVFLQDHPPSELRFPDAIILRQSATNNQRPAAPPPPKKKRTPPPPPKREKKKKKPRVGSLPRIPLITSMRGLPILDARNRRWVGPTGHAH